MIRSKPEQALSALEPVVDLDMYDLEDWDPECSACGLRELWEVASLELRFTNSFELKNPMLVETED